jgi:hypothetical protein
MDNVVDLRPKTPPSAADVEATVTAALTDLVRLETEAAANGDPMRSHFTVMKMVLQSLKTIAEFTAACGP